MSFIRNVCFPRLSVKVLFTLFALTACFVCTPAARAAFSASSTIIISQIFGGAATTGSPVNVKYVELFNKSQSPVTLTSDGTASGAPWSLQYTAATTTPVGGVISAANTFPIFLPVGDCTTLVSTNLGCAVTIPAGGYFLIAGPIGTFGSAPSVKDGVDQTNAMSISVSAGRIFLVSSSTSLTDTYGKTASTTASTSTIDLVGYGSTAVTYDGTGPAATLTAETADVISNPCNYTGNNALDFPTSVPVTVGTPHDSGSPLNVCTVAPVPPTASGLAAPATQTAGFDTVLTVNVTPGTGTSIAVTANLSALGGSATQAFTGNPAGTVFTYTLTIPNSQAVTSYPIIATVTDSQHDTVPTVSIPLTVTANVPVTAIDIIQGTPPAVSSYIGQTVSTTGIVTGIRSNGFYIQTSDSNADTNLATPEGIYVNTGSSAPPASVVVGNDLQVSGMVTSPITTTGFLASPLELDSPSGYGVISTGRALPTPITLTSTNLSPTGAYTQLLAYQSMRMTAPSLTTVSGTSGTLNEPAETYTSNGQFYGVLTGTARPFRAAGVDIRSILPAAAPSGTTRWTPPANVLQVDSAALGGTAINLTTNAVLTPATGVLDYSTGTPLLMISSVTAELPVVTTGTTGTATTAASPSQFSVGQLNMQRFYNATGGVTGAVTLTSTAYARRLLKASAAIRNSLAFPDVVAVQEVENLATLSDLATQISSDATTNSQTDPVYVAYVGTDDSDGLANGFLVKSTKINLVGSPVTLSTTTNYTDPATGSQPIFDEPPFLLTASVARGTGAAYPVDVISAELYPATDIDSTTVSGASTLGASVRAKRWAQAEALAGGIQSVIGGSSATPVILTCSCNAYEFSDGFVDVVGTLLGSPAPVTTVVLADTPGIIPTGMTDTTTMLAATDRYVTIENGFTDALDHILYSAATPAGTTIAAAHIDADFNVTYRNDSSTEALTTPYETSDHDALVATIQVPLLSTFLTFNPSSLTLTFGAQAVGSTSAAEPVIVTNTGMTAITISSIVTSARFGQTNNCSTSLAANSSCTINVTFSPTTAGSPTGTLVLTDSDTTGTQTITLTGSSHNVTATTTMLTATPTAPIFTQSVVLTATIPSNGTSVPSGTVTFMDGGTTLGTAVTLVPGSTSSTATYTAAALTAGTHPLTAVYSGDSYFATSTGSLALPVAAVTTSTAVSASLTTTTFGVAVALTANASSNLGVPGGTVQFYDGTTALGAPQTLTAGRATYTTTALAVGQDNITARYSGSTGTPSYPTSTSGAITVTVAPAPVLDFTMQLGNSQLIVGGTAPSASTGIAITAINGFSSAVSFSCSGLPTATLCSFSPATLTPVGVATGTLTITTINSAANHIPHFRLGSEGSSVAFAFTLLVAPFAFRRRKSAMRMLALLVILIAGAQALTGCGGSVTTSTSTATVLVTATAISGQSHITTITLVTQ